MNFAKKAKSSRKTSKNAAPPVILEQRRCPVFSARVIRQRTEFIAHGACRVNDLAERFGIVA